MFLLPLFVAPAGRTTKLLLLDAPGAPLPAAWVDHLRSLHIEHVSPAALIGPEICRPAAREAALVAALRRWCFARKPDAGFLLSGGFPATLLQARIFDEWLDVRDESLDAVLCPPAAPAALVDYYDTQGLVLRIDSLDTPAAAPAALATP